MTRTLYDITNDWAKLDTLLEELDGDISDPRVEAYVDSMLDQLNTDLEAKVDGYYVYIKELQARADARERESRRLAAKAKRDSDAAIWLTSRLKLAFQLRKIRKLEVEHGTVSLRNNGGQLPVDVFDPLKVPHDLCREVPARFEPDKDLIREAVAEGRDVPGAKVLPRGTHLRLS